MRVSLKTFLCVAGLCFAAPAWAQGANWTLSEASGRVVVRDASGDRPASRGTVVSPGATVLTGKASRAVLVKGDDFLTMSASSRVRIPDAQAPSMIQVLLEWGTGLFKVKHTDKPHFGVTTPYLAAVVKGTTFTVTVGPAGSSLQVLDGAVGVATVDGGANDLIRPGMVASIAAGDRYRLSVQGQQARVIDSPLRDGKPTVGDMATPNDALPGEPVAPPSGSNTSKKDASDDFAWSDVAGSVIGEPVEAKPVDLSAATGGLVGNGAAPAVVAVAALVPLARGNDVSPPAGKSDGGKNTDNGKGSGNGTNSGTNNGGGNGNGNGGTNNGGGNGNGNGNGNGGTNNGGGNGNGNGGTNSGTDNGNGNGGTNNGGGNGNGNGGTNNGGGNGNGNGGTNSGTDNGNGNGGTNNGGGNGNGNGGTNNGGGNGNGNGGTNSGTDNGNGNGGTNSGTDNGNGNGGTNNGGGNGNGKGKGNVDGNGKGK